ncbi:MAG TPA: hypothetical protein VFO67_09810, partial [Gemmatimonadales bacterium]|nr:hypothetical protein [Gemmatimonadales bacterium]
APGAITAVGVTGTIMTPVGGGTITIGQYLIYGGGEGAFVTIGSGIGVELSLGVSFISSDNFKAFEGDGRGSCYGWWAISYCRFSNDSGVTSSFTAGPSARILPGSFSGWNGTTTTIPTDPVPRRL